jgi:hypothetical protein
MKDKQQIGNLFRKASDDPVGAERSRAYRELFECAPELAAFYMDKAADDRDPLVKATAAELLAHCGDWIPHTVHWLRGLLGDDSESVRSAARRSLESLANHSDPKIASDARAVLAKPEAPPAAPSPPLSVPDTRLEILGNNLRLLATQHLEVSQLKQIWHHLRYYLLQGVYDPKSSPEVILFAKEGLDMLARRGGNFEDYALVPAIQAAYEAAANPTLNQPDPMPIISEKEVLGLLDRLATDRDVDALKPLAIQLFKPIGLVLDELLVEETDKQILFQEVLLAIWRMAVDPPEKKAYRKLADMAPGDLEPWLRETTIAVAADLQKRILSKPTNS